MMMLKVGGSVLAIILLWAAVAGLVASHLETPVAQDIWTIISALIGVVIGFVGTWMGLERVRND